MSGAGGMPEHTRGMRSRRDVMAVATQSQQQLRAGTIEQQSLLQTGEQTPPNRSCSSAHEELPACSFHRDPASHLRLAAVCDLKTARRALSSDTLYGYGVKGTSASKELQRLRKAEYAA